MTDLIACILEIYLDIQYWIKHKKQRKFEKENNLPKRIVWHPIAKPLLILFLVFIPISFIFFFFNLRNESQEKTQIKMLEVSKILEAEKRQFGKYPKDIKEIIRNNPLRKGITLDYWENEFVYVLSKDSLHYTIISLGVDEKLNTSDDILISNKEL